MLLLYFVLFVLGACVGSFLNVLIDRIPIGKSVLFSRSACEKCLKQIFIFDLIPLLSYIILRGRCRYCRVKIPARLFLVELIVAVLFPLAFIFAFINIFQYAVLLIILLIILGISVADIDKGIIPDKLLILLGVFSLLHVIFQIQNTSAVQVTNLLGTHLLAGVTAFLFLLLIFMVTRGRGIGFGDVKYAFFIGFLLNFKGIIIVFYAAFLTGAVISIILVLAGKKKLKGESIAFGPFLSLGVVLALLFEKQILEILGKFLNF
jgi:leader peptidase (prepilin peptidase) / N-methyltransferase